MTLTGKRTHDGQDRSGSHLRTGKNTAQYYRELEQEYFCKTTAWLTLFRFRRQLPMLKHGHP